LYLQDSARRGVRLELVLGRPFCEHGLGPSHVEPTATLEEAGMALLRPRLALGGSRGREQGGGGGGGACPARLEIF